MTKRMIIMLLLVGVVLGGVFGFQVFKGIMIKKYMASMGSPVQTISSIKATSQEWQPRLTAVGSLRAVQGADLSPEVAGIIETISFESGTDVEAGTTLVQLRAEDDVARLHSLEANAQIASINFDRDTKQLKAQAVSQASVDNDKATLDAAKAQVAQQQATLDKKTIKAPFSGHLGIRQVDVGQYLGSGTAIVTLQQLDPIYIDFNMPAQNLPQLVIGQKVAALTDAHPDKTFTGEIIALNSKVDEATRNIQVRASFANPDHLLLPGMFANVDIDTGVPTKALTLPQTAITYNPYGNTVYIVDSSDPKQMIAKQVFVTTGDTRGDQVIIEKGIKEGDEIVTSGQIKLRNGAPIKVDNSIHPTNDANPDVQDR